MEIEEGLLFLFISQGELFARFSPCPHRGWVQAHAVSSRSATTNCGNLMRHGGSQECELFGSDFKEGSKPFKNQSS
jgi:hypothetical protein